MGGLLYKDFVAIKGKRLVWILVIVTVAYTILRMAFPGTVYMEQFIVTNDNGETGNLIDMFFIMGEFVVIWMGGWVINMFGLKTIQFDEKNKLRGYLSSLPFDKKAYVASKYIFTGILAYVAISLYLLWHVICTAFMGEGFIAGLSALIMSFSIPFISLVLLIMAVELPAFLIAGKDKSNMVIISIVMLVAIVILGYLLFGDLSVLEKINYEKIINWLDAHAFEMTLLFILFPMVTLGLYYLSYRIAAKLYVRKEDWDD